MIQLSLPLGDMTVLALGAHPDDVEIGCGGTLIRLAESRGIVAHVAVLTGTAARQAEAKMAADQFLGSAPHEVHLFDLPDGRLPAYWGEVKARLEDLATAIRPDVVLAPRSDDAHQDHRLVADLVRTVWRDALVLHYEIPKWEADRGTATHYVPIDEATARRKVFLLDACYPSQQDRDWWDSETFLGLMRLRGVECRSRYAEGFVVDKAVVGL